VAAHGKGLLELPLVDVAGTPAQMGEGHGAALRDLVRAFVPMRLHAARDWGAPFGVDVADVLRAALACLDVHSRWDPAGAAEHHGIARGAGVDPVELYAAANMTDVRDVVAFSAPVGADREGCSVLLLPAAITASGRVIAAQTWDLNPQDLDHVVAVRRRPDSGRATWSVTCSGCLSLVGINDAGVAVGTTNIKVRGSQPGVAYLGVLHRMLACASAAEAARVCEGAPRAAAHTYWAADSDGFVEWEATAWSAARRDDAAGPLWRTNHCLDLRHQAAEAEPPSPSSRARLARLAAASRRRHDVASLQALFADRSDGVDSINRLPEDGQGTATNSVAVCLPSERALWACRGPADRGLWVRLGFDQDSAPASSTDADSV